MSTAGIERAEEVRSLDLHLLYTSGWLLMMQVLQTLGLTQINGDEKYPRDSVPLDFVSVEPFNIMQHANEDEATAPYVTYLMVGLDSS